MNQTWYCNNPQPSRYCRYSCIGVIVLATYGRLEWKTTHSYLGARAWKKIGCKKQYASNIFKNLFSTVQTDRKMSGSSSLKGKRDNRMRFLSFGFLHKSDVRPQISIPKYLQKYFCFRGDINENILASIFL